MIGRLVALILLGTASLMQTVELPEQIALTVIEVGDSLILTCPIFEKEFGLFYWYKIKFGQMVQIVAAGTFQTMSLKGQFDNRRFNIIRIGDLYSLTIVNVSKEDEATYFCQAGAAYEMKFINGTILAVNDHKNQHNHVYVRQSPETASVEVGESTTLQCSLLFERKENGVQCPDEHSVHWFRAGSGNSHTDIICTHSNRSDKQEERSCVYSLSKTIKDSSDAGTYYCAVVTCGQILIGDGTKVETSCPVSRSEPDIVLGVLLACSVTLNAILICYIHRKKYCAYYKGTMSASLHLQHDMSTVDQSSGLDVESEAVNCDTVDFSTRRVRQVQKRNESPQECVYSDVKIVTV